MAKALTYLSIYLVLSIVPSNAQEYTFITNDMVKEVFEDAGYTGDNVQKWINEGKAIHSALDYIFDPEADTTIFEEEKKRIQVIVASTGGNSCTYIYGEADRLDSIKPENTEKPTEIIVVYTLNYVNSTIAAKEYTNFKAALKKLIYACAKQSPPIQVDVRQFRPVIKDESTLDEQYDYQDFGETTMTPLQLKTQQDTIYALHDAVDETIFVSTVGFKDLLDNPDIKVIVDCVVGSGIKTVDSDNQLLTAIPRAQIRIMAEAILTLKLKGVFVIANENPSAMDERGNWTIHPDFRYPVDVILSCVWNKELVNSRDLKGDPLVLVLDIEYKETRLFDVLLAKISGGDPELVHDVTMAQKQDKGGVIAFKPRMVVL